MAEATTKKPRAKKAPANAKYELLTNDTVKSWDGRTLFRIRALVAIGLHVAAGDLGGYIEKQENLQVSGDAWVYGNARVYGNAQVSGDARVYGDASFGWLSKVGSENGTLTWFITKDRQIVVNRGCFNGTLHEFSAAVEKRHGDNRIGQEYRLLVQFIELRASAALENFSPSEEAA